KPAHDRSSQPPILRAGNVPSAGCVGRFIRCLSESEVSAVGNYPPLRPASRATSPPLSWGRGRGPSLAATASSPPSNEGEVVGPADRSGDRTSYAFTLPQERKHMPAAARPAREADRGSPAVADFVREALEQFL